VKFKYGKNHPKLNHTLQRLSPGIKKVRVFKNIYKRFTFKLNCDTAPSQSYPLSQDIFIVRA
jgi:hypothetical protein